MGGRRGSAVFVWSDRALFVGDRSETALHAHHAIEICVSLDALGIEMRSPDGPHLRGAPGVVVRSNAPHQLSIPGPKVAVFYVDPHAPVGPGIHTWLGDSPIRALPDALVTALRPAVDGLFTAPSGLDEAHAVFADLCTAGAPDPPRPRVDFRIKRVRTWLDERIDTPPTQAEAAAHVGLSASRFGHLFKAQVGLPMRRYLLWVRLRRALTAALDGMPMSDAAHHAGFSDAAHFTRTCVRMFGLPPTAFAPVDAVFVG